MDHSIVQNLLIFLALAIFVSALCHKLKVSSVLGFLLAGCLVGPNVLGLVADTPILRGLAELGIVFLLFLIGMELSFERLKVIRYYIFGFGAAQVFLTSIVGGLIINFTMDVSSTTAMVLGLAIAFSSTAFVLQILSDRNELTSKTGRIAIAILIFQDLVVVPLLVMIPLLKAEGDAWSMSAALLIAFAKAAGAMLTIFLLARVAIRPLFRVVSATGIPEVFVSAVLFAVIGISFATEAIGLSYSLGAFFAGVMLSSTEYRHQIEADIRPVRGLLMGVFFLTVGMAIEPRTLQLHSLEIIVGVLLLMLLKALILLGLGRLFRLKTATALQLGLLLSQGGEFIFVVLARSYEADLVSDTPMEMLTAIVAVSMILTPILVGIGNWAVKRRTPEVPLNAPIPSADDTNQLSDHVIVIGSGRVGQTVSSVLEAQNVRFIAIDSDPNLVAALRASGRTSVFFGDVRNIQVLATVGAARARAVVLTINAAAEREKLVPQIRQLYPTLRVLVRARDRRQARKLEIAGATAVVPETLEGSLQLAGLTLRHLGASSEDVHALLDDYRRSDYAKLALALNAAE